MKLSKRERILICVLIIVLVIYAVYRFIPTMSLFNFESLKAEHSLKTVEYDNMTKNILLKSKYEEKLQILSEEINNLNVISDLQQERIIVFLNKYFTKNNLDTTSISFTDFIVLPMDSASTTNNTTVRSTLETMMDDINNRETSNLEYDNNVEVNEGYSQEPQESLTVKAVTVNITFQSTYENMLKFVNDIQNHPYDISITNISTSLVLAETSEVSVEIETNEVSKKESIIQGNMVLNLYEIPKLDAFKEQNEDWIWKDSIDVH